MAVQAVLDENIATPILIGRRAGMEVKIDRLGLRIDLDHRVEIFDPSDNNKHEAYAAYYHEMVGRNGVSVDAARKIMRDDTLLLRGDGCP